MITTGFEIAFGIFLFIVVLIILVYGLAASLSAIVVLWAWVNGLWGKGNLLVRALIICSMIWGTGLLLHILGVI